MNSADHYVAGEKKLAEAGAMTARDSEYATALATVAAAHFAAAKAGVAAQAAGLANQDSRGPSDWWTALHGEGRP